MRPQPEVCGEGGVLNRQDFWSKVERADNSQCWQWRGFINHGGYGLYGKFNRRAHRLAYRFLVGRIPKGLTIDHLCRNRACVNPAHMEPVTRGENVMRGTGLAPTNAL